MQISKNGIDLICAFESFIPNPYPDPATGGEPITIGYGATIYPTGAKVTMQDAPITKEQAITYMLHHIANKCYPALNGLTMSQNQFDALCSFIYNVGAGNFKTSTMRKLTVAGAGTSQITAEFYKWNKAAGKVMAGLTRRRSCEAYLYLNGENLKGWGL